MSDNTLHRYRGEDLDRYRAARAAARAARAAAADADAADAVAAGIWRGAADCLRRMIKET